MSFTKVSVVVAVLPALSAPTIASVGALEVPAVHEKLSGEAPLLNGPASGATTVPGAVCDQLVVVPPSAGKVEECGPESFAAASDSAFWSWKLPAALPL